MAHGDALLRDLFAAATALIDVHGHVDLQLDELAGRLREDRLATHPMFMPWVTWKEAAKVGSTL